MTSTSAKQNITPIESLWVWIEKRWSAEWRIAFVHACWHQSIVDRGRDGFFAEMKRLGQPFDKDTAARFRNTILARGGSRDIMEGFVEFRGRKPSIEPLLKQTGIAP